MTTPGKRRVTSETIERHLEGAHSYSSPPCLMHELEMTPTEGHEVQIKRIYDAPALSDGYRVLVDRIWPRGIKKRDAALDDWLRELAPSTKLRKWFGHDPRRWNDFRERYRLELREQAPRLNALRQEVARRRVTLIYSARDPRHNQAVVLKEVIQES